MHQLLQDYTERSVNLSHAFMSLMKLQLQILPTLTHCPNTRDQIIFLDQYHSQENIYLHR